jgi:hypothetical protein
MDVNKIFGLFGSGSEDKEIKEEKAVLIDFKDHPAYWLGMFKKLILNHKLFSNKIIYFLEQVDPEMNTSEMKESGDHIAYERAWQYIKKFNINEESHKESINLVIDENLVKTMDYAILHFQELELYERCAHIKKISDEIKKLF